MKTRTEHSIQNASVAMIAKVISLLLAFVARVIFTRTLQETYVGINGLFTDILNVLSLTELGIGTAITFSLYKPLAENDHEKIKSLMKLYQHFYWIVSALILTFGLILSPFLPYIIKDQGKQISNLYLIYFLYLSNSVVSYLLIYKKTLIDADQKSYLTTSIRLLFICIQYVLQILILLLTKNFILYLLGFLICTVAGNIVQSKKAEKMYPYLREKSVKPLEKSERKEISKNVRAMMLHKIGDVIVNNTDNLLLSAFVSLHSVGCYSNYFLVIGSVRQVFTQMFSGINASIGNLGVLEGEEKVRKTFLQLFFICEWLYGFASICLFELLSPFIELSFGKQYVFTPFIVLILSLNFFVTGMRQASLSFRDSLGLFWYARYKAMIEALINLVVSIIFAKLFGAIGVFIGTFVSTMTTSFWIEPLVLYKYGLKKKPFEYFFRYIVYFLVTLIAGVITHLICRCFTGNAAILLLKRLPVCFVIPNIIFFFCFFQTEEFKVLLTIVKSVLKKKGT